MLKSPLIENLTMFDTLSFSQKMQKVGMTELLANELAYTLRDMNVGHFNTLLTREEFKNFEKEICFEIEEIRGEMKNLVTKTEFQNFEKEIRFEIEEIHGEMKNLVTKTEFQNFEKEMRQEIEYIHDDIQEIRVEFKNEIEKMVTKTEFNTKIKNLELNITIKMGAIMATGISILTMIIKM
jgi:hypothetical protein